MKHNNNNSSTQKRRRLSISGGGLLFLVFNNIAAVQGCTPTAGTYCPSSSSTAAAVDCPAGYYCTGVDPANDHTACPANTYRGTSGATSVDDCLPCAQFTVARLAGAATCQVCQAGTYYTSTAADFSDGACSACPAGTTSVANTTSGSCQACQAGSFAGTGGSSACKLCKPGSYQDASGTSACKPCDNGKYTYTINSLITNGFNAVSGAVSSSQCVILPTAAKPLICLPGSYMDVSGCPTCPLGYYCPLMTSSITDVDSIRTCPSGTRSPTTGATDLTDCTVAALLEPFTFNACSIAPPGVGGGLDGMSGLEITAMTTSYSTNTVFFTTATAVYRLFLETNTRELLAGVEGTAGSNANAIGTLAFFTALTAIGVDLDGAEAGIIVVGDGNAVRMINVFSRQVTLLGVQGEVAVAGGIALRRDNTAGARLAYVSDSSKHRIMAFNLDNLQSYLVAGDPAGFPGHLDGTFTDASFFRPKGIAFMERAMNSSRMLLVADSGNNLIRVVDTETLRTVSTWFKPLDHVKSELENPVAISVAVSPTSNNGLPIVYVTDGGGGISAIQFPVPADWTMKVLTKVVFDGASIITAVKAAFAHGLLVTGANNAVGFTQLLVMDGSTIRSLVQDVVAGSVAGGGGSGQPCHLPCVNSDCSAVSSAGLCGNSFLDPGEQCDNGFANPNSGCNMTTCTIRVGFVCPVGMDACHEPYPAYQYAPTGVWYRETDCLALTPTPGYTIDSHCVETDIDECAMGTASICDIQSKCLNTPGSYTCDCFDTFFGDGQSCLQNAYAVYSILDIRKIPRSLLSQGGTLSSDAEAVLTALKNAYATIVSSAVPSGTATVFKLKNISTLAQMYTSYSLDPAVTASSRLEVVTLFETGAMAALAAAAATAPSMQAALSLAVFNNTDDVVVYQMPKVRMHRSTSFSETNVIDGWGMDIISVTYNRTCVVPGVTPTGGCWQVEMIYMGGQELPQSNQNSNDIHQSKNVLYLPRLDHDPVSMQLSAPAQALTMDAGLFFPCDVASSSAAGKGITSKATACCLRNVEASYRPHAAFADFLNSDKFNAAVSRDTCALGTFNDTYPESNVVFQLPAGDGATNDLVVGKIEGMPHSEVRLLETIDYTTRTFRVQLVLEEGDLRMYASIMRGIWGLDYNLTFFVGLANFKGTGTSIMNTRNSVQFITVSKSSTLTISTFGADQDPLVSSVDMQLLRIKVTDFFRPVSYLYYLQPVFTMPSNFKSPLSGSTGIVPLDSIRLIKTQGLPKATDPGWMQACSSTDGNYVYANGSLRLLVQRAQLQSCVQANLQMCYPPAKANSVISFGIQLPIDFIQSTDYSTTNPFTLNVQFMIQAFDTAAMTNVYSMLSMTVDITALGFTAICETKSASQNLADIIQGNIYIGTAVNDYEWETTLQKKLNIDVPGTTPSSGFEFAATTVQGAIMTFAALGDPAYFEDPRSLTQNVHIHDIHSVHFLEPLGGKAGPSPNFDAVMLLFHAGTAFVTKTDSVQHSEWMEPSAALLRICPYKATAGKMACLTRTESTFKNTNVTRDANRLIELRQQDNSSIDEMKNLMSQVMMQGGVNDFTNNLGVGFYNELSTKLALNNRYRKAYVINPIVDWTFEAVQSQQRGATAYTVCSKVIAIGMITIRTPEGTQLARRLLSTELIADESSNHILMQKFHALDMMRKRRVPHKYDMLLPLNEGGRHLLLQEAPAAPDVVITTSNNMQPSLTQTGNSMVLNVDAPGYEATLQLCGVVLNAPYRRCNILQLQTRISGAAGQRVCDAELQGTLATSLHQGLAATLAMDTSTQIISGINGAALLEYRVDGCVSHAPGGRRLLATDSYAIVSQHVIVSSVNGSATINMQQMQYLQDFFNTTTWGTILGGGGYVSFVTITFTDINGQTVSEIKVNVVNATIPKDQAVQMLNHSVAKDITSSNDKMFFTDFSTNNNVAINTQQQQQQQQLAAAAASSSAAERVTVLGLNLLLALALCILLS